MNESIVHATADQHAEDLARGHLLPSGRSVVLRVAGEQEELEVRSPTGEVEVRITLSSEGAVVNLRAARLELESAETVTVNCRRFAVNSAEGTDLNSGGELRIKTEGDMHFNGGVIHLNC